MLLKNNETEQLQEYGELLMLPKDVADILEINQREFISELNDFDSDIRKLYFKGILLTEVKIRKKAVGKPIEATNKDTVIVGDFIDVEEVSFSIKDLKEFKSKLLIQLHG